MEVRWLSGGSDIFSRWRGIALITLHLFYMLRSMCMGNLSSEIFKFNGQFRMDGLPWSWTEAAIFWTDLTCFTVLKSIQQFWRHFCISNDFLIFFRSVISFYSSRCSLRFFRFFLFSRFFIFFFFFFFIFFCFSVFFPHFFRFFSFFLFFVFSLFFPFFAFFRSFYFFHSFLSFHLFNPSSLSKYFIFEKCRLNSVSPFLHGLIQLVYLSSCRRFLCVFINV